MNSALKWKKKGRFKAIPPSYSQHESEACGSTPRYKNSLILIDLKEQWAGASQQAI